MCRITFKKGDWAQIKKNKPFQIVDNKTAKICTLMQYKKSSEEECKEYVKCHTKT